MHRDLLTEAKAAELLGISPKTLARMRRKKIGPPVVYAGKSPRYHRRNLNAWMRGEIVPASTAA